VKTALSARISTAGEVATLHARELVHWRHMLLALSA
jgi:hypothetical protein